MKKAVLILIAAMAALMLVFSAFNVFVLTKTDKYILSAPELDKAKYDCILVLGAGIKDAETPSDMLRDRLTTAIGLYKLGYSKTLLLSGDRSGDHYDEVAVMKKVCLENGIPEEAIICDGKGYSTYESMDNTRNAGEYKRIIIVTQEYHLSRAVYIAREMGFDAHGICADVRSYRGQLVRDVRECFARMKDVVKVM
ncbi:MAG: YdcF family protein [Clostridia bacterium]|nr:YdcF family protein [Clostridia bacterium]